MPTPTISDEGYGTAHLARRKLPTASPLEEYVSGGENAWLASYYRALPLYVDEISRDFGDDIYERMLLDPQVESCVEILKAAILHGGLNITARVGEDDEGFGQAKDIADFCKRNVENLSRPFVTEVLWDMLDALVFGNRVAEQIYAQATEGDDAGKLILKALKPKPRRAVAFVVDAYANVIGLLGLQPGKGYHLLSGTIVGDPKQVPNLLPRRKFAVLSFRPRSCDPRGSSIARPAYNAWWLKMQVWPEYLRYITQFASPSVDGETAPGAVEYPEVDADGNAVLDSEGAPVLVNPEQAMLTGLLEWRNGFGFVHPSGSKVTVHWPQGEGAPFTAAIALFDQQIAKAILCQTLATEQAQHQARAASETHADVMGMLIGYCKGWVEGFIEGDIFAPLVEYNFGREALALVPKASLGDTSVQDFAGELTALSQAGYATDTSQYPGIDARLGLPKRDPASLEHAQQMKETTLQGMQAKAAAPDAVPNGKQPAEKP